MIRINIIKEKSADLWKKGTDGSYDVKEGAEYIGNIKTVLEFLDVRVQIKKLKTSEYFIYFEGSIYDIDADGRIFNYPKGLFDKMDDLLIQLL